MKVTSLDSQWCERSVIEQAVSLCRILIDIDWLSVFKDCSEIVRVKLRMRDQSSPEQVVSLPWWPVPAALCDRG